jgi:ABC-type lipoprotein release transport system permease subunit
MFSVYGVASALLAAIGLFSLLAFSARQRTAEIGVRKALGATPLQIVQMFLHQGFNLVVVGWLTGVVGAMLAAQYLESMLYRVEPMDLPTFGAATALLAVSALLGVIVPAWRAACVDPIQTLRDQ